MSSEISQKWRGYYVFRLPSLLHQPHLKGKYAEERERLGHNWIIQSVNIICAFISTSQLLLCDVCVETYPQVVNVTDGILIVGGEKYLSPSCWDCKKYKATYMQIVFYNSAESLSPLDAIRLLEDLLR